MIHQGSRFHDPCVASMRTWVMAFLGAIDGALLLRFANKDDTLVLSKFGAPLAGDIIFALSLSERDHRNLIVLGVPLDGLADQPLKV